MIRVEKLTKVYTSGILKKRLTRQSTESLLRCRKAGRFVSLASRVAENQRFP